MIIDFHTHIYPRQLSERTLRLLSAPPNVLPQTDGTYEGLVASMQRAQIDYSVILPVVTKPSQFAKVNAFAQEVNGRNGIISFGGIHPDSENYMRELDYIHSLGFKGIKLHPDYQGTYIDDSKYLDLITYAVDLGLIIVIHAGVDVGLPSPVHCPPDKSAIMLNHVEAHAKEPSSAKIVLAHMGGFHQWDEVEQHLVGRNVYFDLAYSLQTMESSQLYSIIRNHGIERILFATDSPWSDQEQYVHQVQSFPFEQSELDAILGSNAAKLLDI